MNPVLLAIACFLLFFQDSTYTEPRTASSPVPTEYRTEAKNNLKLVAVAHTEGKAADRNTDQLVYSAPFRKAARDAWKAARNGTARYETGFSIDQNRRPGKLQSSEFAPKDAFNHLRIVSKSSAVGTFHIHTRYGDPRPSEMDINTAKTIRKMVYVASHEGLYSVDPDGNVCHVFNAANWFERK